MGVCWASARYLMYTGDRDWERKTVYTLVSLREEVRPSITLAGGSLNKNLNEVVLVIEFSK